ncbi:MAG: GNAT family N-acetyltransferase [Candidatus Eisenbacteria bacterium]
MRKLDGRLVRFARVLTDGRFHAFLLDVIVDRQFRGRGFAHMLMEAVVGHPGLSDVHSIELIGQPELVGFYEKWGSPIA